MKPLESVVETEVDKVQLLRAIRYDCVTFLAFYLQDELTLEVPEFHEEIWEEFLEILQKVNHPDFLIGHLQKLFAVPREHAKSTLAKLAVILFMRYSVLSFTLYVSRTATVALAALRDVVDWLTSENESHLYGPAEIQKKNETEGLWILSIHVPGRRSLKKVILKAIGQQHQVRGTLIDNRRPELVILDDIEDYETADDDKQQKKLDTWVMGSLMKATARRSVRIFIGNMVRKSTLLARIAKDPAWNPTVFGSIVRDKTTHELIPLWKGRWTVEALLEDYKTYRSLGLGHVWEAEMMNLTADEIFTGSLSKAPLIPAVDPEEVTAGFICLDPAFGEESWHDESAITVHVLIEGQSIPYICHHRKGRWTENELLTELIQASYYWNLTTWTIEAEAAQKLLIPVFRLLLRERQINPELFTILPLHSGKKSKASRIVAFRNTAQAGSYGFAEDQTDLILKLESYDPTSADHDDLCDSAAYGPIAFATYGDLIKSQGVSNVAGAIMQPGGLNTRSLGERDVCPL